ncbi:MAG: cellulase family glycosylhydrolase [Spirochaetales bacterium]|nr:cellulase family glycosylhydrolase [Spirochaetales bacterium]
MMKIIPHLFFLVVLLYGCETLPSPLSMEDEDIPFKPTGGYPQFQETTGVNIGFPIDRDELVMIKDAGFRWIRTDMKWSGIETVSGFYPEGGGCGNRINILTRSTVRAYNGDYSLLFDWRIDTEKQDGKPCYAEIGRMYRLPDDTKRIHFAAYGDNSRHMLFVRIMDAAGEIFQYPAGPLSFSGWKTLTVTLSSSAESWGGEGNGELDYPVYLKSIAIALQPGRAEGQLFIDEITLERSSRRTAIVIENFEDRSGYDFEGTGYDSFVAEAQGMGLNNYFVLYGSNRLYETDMSVRSEKGRNAFAAFAAAAVARYDQYYTIWEIWNEPDTASSWTPQPSIDEYMLLVEKTSAAIEKTDPYAIVYAPAVSGLSLSWLSECFGEGLLELIDGVSVHLYRNNAPEKVIEDYGRLRELINAYKPENREIALVAGEWGYPLIGSGENTLTEELQASYAVRMMLINYYQGASRSIWYNFRAGFRDSVNDRGDTADFGLVTSTLQPRKGYDALSVCNRFLSGYTFGGKIKSKKGDYILRFENEAKKLVYTLWTGGSDHEVVLPLESGKWELFDMYGKRIELNGIDTGCSVRVSGDVVYLKQK